MKIVITTVSFPDELDDVAPRDKTQALVNLIPVLSVQTENLFGNEAICLIITHEYALTAKSISIEQKKELKTLLHETVKIYPNVVLIPGSIPCHSLNRRGEPKSLPQRKKIANNYLEQDSMCNEEYAFNELTAAEDILADKSLDSFYVLQNATHVMTADTIIKHKKCAPFKERERLQLNETEKQITERALYYIGADKPVKKIQMQNGNQFNLGILICMEHAVDSDFIEKALHATPPDILAIIANDVEFYTDKIMNLDCAFAAKIDKHHGLSFALNNEQNKFTHLALQELRILDIDNNLVINRQKLDFLVGESNHYVEKLKHKILGPTNKLGITPNISLAVENIARENNKTLNEVNLSQHSSPAVSNTQQLQRLTQSISNLFSHKPTSGEKSDPVTPAKSI